jgi:tryptophan-rich hypothetical protein
MNKINPKKLNRSKWTAVDVKNKEKHFIVTEVNYDEDDRVTSCLIEAVYSKSQYSIDWRSLNNREVWLNGWK